MNVENQDITVLPEARGIARSGVSLNLKERVLTALNALVARLLAPVDNASIVTFRVFFGIMMMWEINRYFAHGWIDSMYIDPPYLFPYMGFGWVTPLPSGALHALFFVLGILALCITVGFLYRITTTLFFLGFTYIFLLDKADFLNHLYLATLISFLMIFVPAHRAFSVDAMRRPSIRSSTAPTWALVLLALQVGIVYFYGGLAKLNGDWLRGEPMRWWLSDESDLFIIGRWVTEEWLVYAVSWGGVLFDLFIVPLLLWKRTRWFAVIAAVLFHRFNAAMFSIGIFPMFATLALVLFLPPDLPRRILRVFETSPAKPTAGAKSRRRARAKAQVQAPAEAEAELPFLQRPLVQRVTVSLVVGYIALQLLIPLRQHLYPGNVAWTDYGDRFSWRMMLHSTTGDVSFEVLDPATGETWVVDPDDYLTTHQQINMTGQPDMILQFSHFLADEWRRNGHENVEVRANTMISLNGRDPYPMVDPDANLAAEELSIGPVDWITSLEEQERLARERGTDDNPE